MTARLKKAKDAREWVAERLLSARIALHAARAEHDNAEAAAAARPHDQLAQRRVDRAHLKAIEANAAWHQIDDRVKDIAQAKESSHEPPTLR